MLVGARQGGRGTWAMLGEGGGIGDDDVDMCVVGSSGSWSWCPVTQARQKAWKLSMYLWPASHGQAGLRLEALTAG
jgi:hypothetical protein